MEPFLKACIDQKREAVKHYAEMKIVSPNDYTEKPAIILKYHSKPGLFSPYQNEATTEVEHVIQSHKSVKGTAFQERFIQ